MSKNKLIDCFPYFNEKEILELRIRLLYDYVDKFVITEANETHSGISKIFECRKVLENIEDPLGKIILLEIDYSKYPEIDNTVKRERFQRDCATIILDSFDDDSLFYFGDCDEILNPFEIDFICNIAESYPQYLVRTPLVFLNGRADLRVFNFKDNFIRWDCPFVAKKHHLKYSPSELREKISYYSNEKVNEFPDVAITVNNDLHTVGWHFSWMGTNLDRSIKQRSYLHHSDNFRDDLYEYIESYFPKEGFGDCLGRKEYKLKKYDINLLPDLILNEKKFRDYFLPDEKKIAGISVVQLGTNDANDDLSEYLLSTFDNLKFGLFVEPNMLFNESIKNRYSKYKNMILENVAIVPNKCNIGDQIELFYHTGDPTYETTSCKIEHINKHMQYYNDGEVKSFYSVTSSLEQLLDKYEIKDLDWLLIDVEGLDSEIIMQFDFSKYNIKRVEFECIHLGDTLDFIQRKLNDLGYTQVNSLHKFDLAFEKI